MHARMNPLIVCAVAALLQGSGMGLALAQNAPAAHPAVVGADSGSASGPGWGADDEAAASDENPDSDQMPVLFITNVQVLRSAAGTPLSIVRVTGLASSEGWSQPQLVPTYAGKPPDNVLDLELIATPPEHAEAASGFYPVSAIFAVEGDAPLSGVRVRGTDNAVTLRELPGAAQAAVKADDCAHCVGEKFQPAADTTQGQQNSGQQAQQGGGQEAQQAQQASSQQTQQSVVRADDLPKSLRVIKENDGIRGAVHDPNRLTLILDRNNNILDAFWE